MKLKIFFSIFSTIIIVFAQAQTLERPKLVVGIVVDQMRWDYLYRYYDRYANNGGFKRLLQNGFSCENSMITYTPTVTASLLPYTFNKEAGYSPTSICFNFN